MDVAGVRRNLDYLDKALRSCSNSPRCHRISCLAPLGRVPRSTEGLAGLLIFDPEAVHLAPRPLPDEPCPPIPDCAGDIYPFNFVVERALSAASFRSRSYVT